MPTILCHGGAWNIPDMLIDDSRKATEQAAKAAFDCLKSGGSAIDAAEAGVRCLEDAPCLNAGYGSCLNANGHCETDAIIMNGKDLSIGAVSASTKIRYPVSAARFLMDKMPHNHMGGSHIDKIAENEPSLETVNNSLELAGEYSRNEFKEWNKYGTVVGNFYSDRSETHGVMKWDKENAQNVGHDTVGCIVLTDDGRMAAATSTGGITAKMPGRVGDTSQPGAGAWADDTVGASSTTGHGESILKVVLARLACLVMQDLDEKDKRRAQRAVQTAIGFMKARVGGYGGCIILDKFGNWGVDFSTERMAWTKLSDNQPLISGIHREDITVFRQNETVELPFPFFMMISRPTIIIHGGAGMGDLPPKYKQYFAEGIKLAVVAGYVTLTDASVYENAGATTSVAMSACLAAVKYLEQHWVFNAGRGCAQTSEGHCEMDAIVMDGGVGPLSDTQNDLKVGAVAGLRNFFYPSQVARAVLEKLHEAYSLLYCAIPQTNHALLACEGGQSFAEDCVEKDESGDTRSLFGGPAIDENWLKTEKSNSLLEKWRRHELPGQRGGNHDDKKDDDDHHWRHGTVGAVAVDAFGRMASVSSTGGMTGKLPGRIGDTPLVGCGAYACDKWGVAVTCTGIGELISRTCLAHDVAWRLSHCADPASPRCYGNGDASLDAFATRVIEEAESRIGTTEKIGGLILVNKAGETGVGLTSGAMCWARMREGESLVWGNRPGDAFGDDDE